MTVLKSNRKEQASALSVFKRTIILFAVLVSPLVYGQADNNHSGRIKGVVVDAETGKAVSGAYVGVGEFGDSGGSNRSRHREKGWFAKGQTDAEGRFELDGLAYPDDDKSLEYHPLIVTHPEYVRHDEKIDLIKGDDVPNITVRLRHAARIDVTVVDESDKPIEGMWAFRLEALDGRRFLAPSRRDQHLGSFASSVWREQPSMRRSSRKDGYTFAGLDTGVYSLDIIKLELVEKPTQWNIWKPVLVYHGGLERIEIKAGQTKEVRIKPANNNNTMTVELPKLSEKLENIEGVTIAQIKKIPKMFFISRNLGLGLWDGNIVYGPEDARLGRLSKTNLFYYPLMSDKIEFKNLPAREYIIFAGPFFLMNSSKVVIEKDKDVTVRIPPIESFKQSTVGISGLARSVEVDKSSYSLNELCKIISEAARNNPKIIADESIANEQIKVSPGKIPIFELLESLYLTKGWLIDEQGKNMIISKSDN